MSVVRKEVEKESEEFVPFLKLKGINQRALDYLGEKAYDVFSKTYNEAKVKDAEKEFSRYLEKAFKDKKVLYFYDVEELGKLISKAILGKYCLTKGKFEECNEEIKIGSLKYFELNKKSVLTLFMKVFPQENLEKAKEFLLKEIENSRKLLEGKNCSLVVSEDHGKLFLRIIEEISLFARVENVDVKLKVRSTTT